MLSLLVCFVVFSVSVHSRGVSVKNGRFFDEHNRELNFRGVNVVYKDAPWLPMVESFDSNLSFVEEDMKFLSSIGVNVIRLGVMWPGVMLAKGLVDQSYIKKPHQDEMNPIFCGEGAPEWWAKLNTQITDFPVPVQDKPFDISPPGRALCDTHSSFSYIWTHDSSRAYQTLYESGEDFADFWYEVAHQFSKEDGVIGGELFNEPFPGAVFADERIRDNKYADLNNLQPFYRNISMRIRDAAKKNDFNIAYEPSWPVGTQDISPDDQLTPTSGFSSLFEEDSIYAFHYYVAPCNPNLGLWKRTRARVREREYMLKEFDCACKDDEYLEARLADAKRLKALPFASEFNIGAGDEKSQVDMMNTFNAFESRFISYTGWQYKSYSGSLPGGTCTGCGNSFFFDNGTMNNWVVDAMARPFAFAVAGRSENVTFGSDSYSFTYIVNSKLNTEMVVPHIYIPSHLIHIQVDVSNHKKDVVHIKRVDYEGGKLGTLDYKGKSVFKIKVHDKKAHNEIVTVTFSPSAKNSLSLNNNFINEENEIYIYHDGGRRRNKNE